MTSMHLPAQDTWTSSSPTTESLTRYTQTDTRRYTLMNRHTHKHTPYKHLHAHKRHTAYIHPHTHTHSRTSTYNQTHTSPTHTDPYAFYLSRLSLPHAHSSAPYVCSFNLSKLFPCGVIRSYSFFCGCLFEAGERWARWAFLKSPLNEDTSSLK